MVPLFIVVGWGGGSGGGVAEIPVVVGGRSRGGPERTVEPIRDPLFHHFQWTDLFESYNSRVFKFV